MAAAAVACLLSACAKTAMIPTSEYAHLQPEARTYLDVETLDGRYRVVRFIATDSTLVIEEVMTAGSSYPATNTRFKKPPYLPYPVTFASIGSIRQIKEPHPGMAVVGAGVFVVATFALMMLIALSLDPPTFSAD